MLLSQFHSPSLRTAALQKVDGKHQPITVVTDDSFAALGILYVQIHMSSMPLDGRDTCSNQQTKL